MIFKPRKQHVYHDENKFGNDFIVGDLHGQVTQLLQQLADINFNFKVDRLFCTGDLISKGEGAIACLNLLTTRWFFSVMGNHEQLFLLGFKSSRYWDRLKQMNGIWLSDNLDQFDLLYRWKTLIEVAMPLSCTININGFNIGVSHASATLNWQRLQRETLSASEIWNTLWARPLQDDSQYLSIDAIDYVVHGHSPVPFVIRINNRLWIDTYTSLRLLTIYNLKELIVS